MSNSISDFTDEQVNAVQIMVNRRFGEEIELYLGDSEVQVDPAKNELVECPVIFWNARDCNFVVIKTGEHEFQAQYFHTPHDQTSTHQAFFNTVEDCASAVLREQSDYERESVGVKDGATGSDLS